VERFLRLVPEDVRHSQKELTFENVLRGRFGAFVAMICIIFHVINLLTVGQGVQCVFCFRLGSSDQRSDRIAAVEWIADRVGI
jgi:hypothetical protein